MSWRTTAILFIVLLIVGGFAYYSSQQAPDPEPTPPAVFEAPEPVALLTGIALEDVTRLEISRSEDGQMASFTRDGAGDWTQTVPTMTQVISQTVNNQVSGLVNLSSRRSLPAASQELSAFGLDEPAYDITLVAMADSETVRYTFHIGDKTPSEDAFYVQRQGDPRVHLVVPAVIQAMIDFLDSPPVPSATPSPSATIAITPTLTITTTLPVSGTVTPGP